MKNKFLVTSIFKSFNGEVCTSYKNGGNGQGEKAIFVRFALCPVHCKWCDTKRSWNQIGKVWYGMDKIIDEVKRLAKGFPKNVTITGGEPLIYNGLPDLCNRLTRSGFNVNIYTSGVYHIDHLTRLEKISLIIDYKAKTAEAKLKTIVNASALRRNDWLKCVISNKSDLVEFAKFIIDTGPCVSRIAVSPVWPPNNHSKIYMWISGLKRNLRHVFNDVVIYVQTHKIERGDRNDY